MQIIRILWQSGTPDPARFRSFGEDLCRLSWSEPHYHVDEKAVDAATDTMELRCRRSMADRALAAVGLLLGRHDLTDLCRIESVREA